MARDVKHDENADRRASRAARAVASLSDPTDYGAVVRAVIENAPMTADERSARMRDALDRLRELREEQLESMGEPLPDGWAARVIREGRP
jgi:hypothetical protein